MQSTRRQGNRRRGTIPDVTLTDTIGNDEINSNRNVVRPNVIAGHDGHIHNSVRCYGRNQFVHYERDLPDKNRWSQLIQYGIIFNNQDIGRGKITDPDWLLLESCSVISSARNQDILNPVKSWTPDEKRYVYTGGVYLDYNWMGTLKYTPLYVFYNPPNTENILSVA